MDTLSRFATATATVGAVVALAVTLSLGFATVGQAATQKPPAPAIKPPVAKPVTPPEPRVTTEGFGDWLLSCVAPPEGAEVCEVVQTLQVRGQAQPLAKLALGHLPGEKRLTMTAALPVDVSFSDPVRVHAGDPKKPLALPWVRCLPGACLASATLETKDIDKIRASKGKAGGNFDYKNAAQQTVSLPLSWRGLDAAITAMEKRKK